MSKERRKNWRKSGAKRSLSPLFGSPKARSSFLTAVSLAPHLSPAHEAPTDRGLTFLQSARDQNVPVRYGKWSQAEDAYLRKLVQLFRDGLLANVDCKTSLRSWLAQMLNCCPMRISKKQLHGRGFQGKSKFRPAKGNTLSPQQLEQLEREICKLRNDFLRDWADDEAGKRRKSFQHWLDRVQELVPTPQLAKPECKPAATLALEPIPVQVECKTPQFASPVTALPLAFCSDTLSVAREFAENGYTICQDQLQLSFHPSGVSLTRKSSRVVVDFGAPSCEEPKCSPFLDYSHWSDADLTEELAALVEPSDDQVVPLHFL